jgi:CelD/BcsL family acetyltransferase involved in cellulose biosynthesis
LEEERTVLVRCCDNLHQWETVRDDWDRLADGCAFRTWTWLSCWWRHYGPANPARQLRIILAYANEGAEPPRLIAALPCYVENSWAQGRVLRLLGDGEVCSDHLGLLAVPPLAIEAAQTIAAHLVERTDWDLLDFDAVDADDAPTLALHRSIADSAGSITQSVAGACWAIELPKTWDGYLATQSKSHRKQLRQLERRVLQSDRARWQLVENEAQFVAAWDALVDLHQRRRRSLGEPGCFASPRWAAFHREVAAALLSEGRLRLSTLELDGTPIAAEYHLAGSHTTYAYQGGVDPDRLDDEPGQLSMICSLQQAIAGGHTAFDLLRGDEPYKAHWRAVPRPTLRLIAAPPRHWPRLRHGAWRGLQQMRRLARQFAGIFT